MKTWFDGEDIFSVESLPFNYGEIEAQKAIKDVFGNLDEDSDVAYNPEFVDIMKDIEKEEPIAIAKYEDLFDDE